MVFSFDAYVGDAALPQRCQMTRNGQPCEDKPTRYVMFHSARGVGVSFACDTCVEVVRKSATNPTEH